MDVFRSPSPVEWRFPVQSAHDGVPLGNGLFGALLWGSGNTLRLTINRGDYWHHEAGFEPGPEATWDNLVQWAATGNQHDLLRVFEGRDDAGQSPQRPTRLPMGRIDLVFPDPLTLGDGSLELATGCAGVIVNGPSRVNVEAVVPRNGALLALRMHGCCFQQVSPGLHPAGAEPGEVQEFFDAHGLGRPEHRASGALTGWTQALPHDPAMAVACLIADDAQGHVTIYIASEYGSTPDMAWARAVEAVSAAQECGYDRLADDEAAWWRSFWAHCARLQLDDATYQSLYEMGMYRLACASMANGPAMGLQGPWIEDDRLAPWQADYHFNINVQMCHWPALAGNWASSFEPLWGMVRRWLPRLNENARRLVGIDDGYTLPHAVDDRGVAMGGFWTGHVDHGCTAWLAHLMWRYYRFTLDRLFLRELAYPLMRGALRVYEEMLVEQEDGRLALPLGVSAEWGGRSTAAWGRNASYQLGLIHALARAIPEAAEDLEIDDPIVGRCRSIRDRLPLFSVGGAQDQAAYWANESACDDVAEIAVWEGLTPTMSHRHFSHLIGLYPLDLFDLRRSRSLQKIVARSLDRLTRAGKGEWCGWSFPWAALLMTRLGMGNGAALNLEAFRRAFTSPNGGPLIFPRLEGLTGMGPDALTMQLDGGMGLTAALQEMMLHTSRGVLYVFPAVPEDWRLVRLLRFRAEGGLIVSAERVDGATRWVRVLAMDETELRMALPFSDSAVAMISSRDEQPATWIGAGIIRRHMHPGEEITLTPVTRLEQR